MDWIHILDDPDPEELDRMMKVGQLVTWPKVGFIYDTSCSSHACTSQLHMIENRMRIEKQIYAGRVEVRRALKKGKTRGVPEPRSLLLPPQSISAATTLQSNGSQSTNNSELPERPLSLDTDAENAFSHGSRWFYRRGRHSPSLGDSSDPLLSPSIRRKWASGLLDIPQNPDRRKPANGEEGAANDEEPEVRPPQSQGSFFARLRQNSMASLSLPFSHSRKGSSDEHADRNTSVDSSSDDESIWPQDYVNHATLRRSTIGVEDGGDELEFAGTSSSEDI